MAKVTIILEDDPESGLVILRCEQDPPFDDCADELATAAQQAALEMLEMWQEAHEDDLESLTPTTDSENNGEN